MSRKPIYKLCAGCSTVTSIATAICRQCGAYRFEPIPAKHDEKQDWEWDQSWLDKLYSELTK